MLANKEVQYAKEIDDCMVLVVELLRDIKAKKGAAEIAGENLQNLINAMAGMDGIKDELHNPQVVAQTVGYRTGELVAVFIAP